MRRVIGYFILGLLLSLFACEKGSGEGGQAKLSGTVLNINYNGNFTIKRDTFPAAEANVYIIYGGDENEFYGDDVKCDHNGYFEFDYLREGDYIVYTYSKDTTLNYDLTSEKIALFRKATISSSKQHVDVGTIYVAK